MNIKLSDILYDDNNSEVTKIFEEQDKKAKIGDPMEKVSADNIVINNAFITQLQDRFPEIIARIDRDFTKVSSGWSKYYASQKEGKPNKKLLKSLIATSLKPLGVLTKADIKKLMTRSIPLPRVGAMHGNAAQVTAGKSQIEGFLNTDFKIYQDRQIVPVFLENQSGEPLSGANNSKGGFGLLFLIPAVGAAIKKENISLYQGLFLDNPAEFKEGKVNIFTNATKVHVLPITDENVDQLAVAFKSSQALLTFAKKYNTSTSFKSTQLNIESNLIHAKGLGQLLESNEDEQPSPVGWHASEEETARRESLQVDNTDWMPKEPESQSVSFEFSSLEDLKDELLSMPTPSKEAKESSESLSEEDQKLQEKMIFLKNAMQEDDISSINYFKVKENINSLIGLDKEALESISNLKEIEFDESVSNIKDDYFLNADSKNNINDYLSVLRSIDNVLNNDAKFVITSNNLISEKTDTTHFDLPVTIPVIVISQHSSSSDMVCENVLLQLKDDLASKFEVASPEEALNGISLKDLEQNSLLRSKNYKEANVAGFRLFRAIKRDVQKLVQSSESKKGDEEKETDNESKKVEGKDQKEKVQNRINSKLPVSKELIDNYHFNDVVKSLRDNLEAGTLDNVSEEGLRGARFGEDYASQDYNYANKQKIYRKIIKSRKDFFSKNTNYNPPEDQLAIENLLQNVLTPKRIQTFVHKVADQFKKDNIGEEFDVEEIREKARKAASKKKSPMRKAYNKLVNVIDKFSKRDFLAKPDNMSFEKYKALTVLWLLLMMDKKLVIMKESFIPGYIQGSLTNLLLNEEKEEENIIRDLTTGELAQGAVGAAAGGAFAYLGLKTYAGLGLLATGPIGIAVTSALAYAWAESIIDQTDIDKVVNELICYLAYPTTIQADMNEYINSLKLTETVENDIEEIANEVEKNSPSQSGESQGGQSQSNVTSSLPAPKQMTLVSQSQLTEIEVIEKLIEGNKASGKIKINELQELVEKIQGFKKELASFKEQMKEGSELINIIKGLQDNKGLNTYNKLKESNSESLIKKFDKVYDYKENPDFAKAFPNLVLTKCCIEISAAFFKEKANLSGEEKEKQNFVAITEDFIQKKGFSARFKYAKKLFDIKYKNLDEALAAQQVGDKSLESGQVFEDDYTSQIMNAINKINVKQVEKELATITSLIVKGDEEDKQAGTSDDISRLDELIETINLEIEDLSEKEATITAVRDLSESDRASRRNALKVIINSMVAEKNSYERKKAEVALKQKNKLNKAQLDAANRALSSKNDNKLIGGFGVGGLLSVLGGVGTAIACPPLAIPAIVGSVFGVAPAGMAGAWLASSSEEGQTFVPEELKFNEYSEAEINKNLDIIETCISQLIEKALNENKYVYKKGLRFLLEDSSELPADGRVPPPATAPSKSSSSSSSSKGAVKIEKSRLEKANRFKSAARRKKLKKVDGELYVTQKDLEATLLGNAFDLYLNNKSAISSETYREFLKNLGSIIKFYHNIDVEEAAKDKPSGIVRDVIFNSKDFNLKEVIGGTIEQLRKACKDAEGSDPFFNAIEELLSDDDKIKQQKAATELSTERDKESAKKRYAEIDYEGREKVFKAGVQEKLKDGPIVAEINSWDKFIVAYYIADGEKRKIKAHTVSFPKEASTVTYESLEFSYEDSLFSSKDIAKFVNKDATEDKNNKVVSVKSYHELFGYEFDVMMGVLKGENLLDDPGALSGAKEVEKGNEQFEKFTVSSNTSEIGYDGTVNSYNDNIDEIKDFAKNVEASLKSSDSPDGEDLIEIEKAFLVSIKYLEKHKERKSSAKRLLLKLNRLYTDFHIKFDIARLMNPQDSLIDDEAPENESIASSISEEQWEAFVDSLNNIGPDLDKNFTDEEWEALSSDLPTHEEIRASDFKLPSFESLQGTGRPESHIDREFGDMSDSDFDVEGLTSGDFKDDLENISNLDQEEKIEDRIVAFSRFIGATIAMLELKGIIPSHEESGKILTIRNTTYDVLDQLGRLIDESDQIQDNVKNAFRNTIAKFKLDIIDQQLNNKSMVTESFFSVAPSSNHIRFSKRQILDFVKSIKAQYRQLTREEQNKIKFKDILDLVDKKIDSREARGFYSEISTKIKFKYDYLFNLIKSSKVKFISQYDLIKADQFSIEKMSPLKKQLVIDGNENYYYKTYYSLFKKYIDKLIKEGPDDGIPEALTKEYSKFIDLQEEIDKKYNELNNKLEDSGSDASGEEVEKAHKQLEDEVKPTSQGQEPDLESSATDALEPVETQNHIEAFDEIEKLSKDSKASGVEILETTVIMSIDRSESLIESLFEYFYDTDFTSISSSDFDDQWDKIQGDENIYELRHSFNELYNKLPNTSQYKKICLNFLNLTNRIINMYEEIWDSFDDSHNEKQKAERDKAEKESEVFDLTTSFEDAATEIANKGVDQVSRENEESAKKLAKAAKRFDQLRKDTSRRRKLSSKEKQKKKSRKKTAKASRKRNRQNSGYEPLGSVLSEFNTNLYQQTLSSLLFEDKDYNRQQKVTKQSSLQEEWRRLWDI